MDLLLYIAAGAAVGVAVGITGVGGGSLMTPLLLLFGFPPHIAIGTDLLYASVTKSSGMYMHAKRRTVQWRVVGLLAAGSLPMAALTGVLLATVFGDARDYASLLTTTLGIMLIITATVLIFRNRLQHSALEGDSALFRSMQRHPAGWTFTLGVILGTLVTLSSVGSGAIGTAILLILYPTFSSTRIVGTDLAHAVPLTLVAGMSHLLMGNVNYMLLVALLIGSFPGIWAGTHLNRILPDRVLRPVLVTVLLVLGIKYVFF